MCEPRDLIPHPAIGHHQPPMGIQNQMQYLRPTARFVTPCNQSESPTRLVVPKDVYIDLYPPLDSSNPVFILVRPMELVDTYTALHSL